ncbi:MAG: SGNH/GDSL hydrolase family protein [Nocardiopsaceae bacterium]|nr:SGNH/GDSL hydrolase family protein [Nocardiopsaceae bacterium]
MRGFRAVSRPAWAAVLSDLAGGGEYRKSPVEILATASSMVTHHRYAESSGLRATRFGRWTDGVNALRADCVSFAGYWSEYNERVRGELAALAGKGAEPGPLWVVLGDSTAQGLGAPGPHGGYVGQALQELRRRTGQPWRLLNLSVSGSLIRDVLANQLSQLPTSPDLVTCGVGANDVFYSSPSRLLADMRTLLAEVPDGTVMLDLPLPAGLWGVVGRAGVPYITRINRVINEGAAERGLPVAEVSAHFTSPWAGKFSADSFHPSQDGYRDWTRALLAAIPAVQPADAQLPVGWPDGIRCPGDPVASAAGGDPVPSAAGARGSRRHHLDRQLLDRGMGAGGRLVRNLQGLRLARRVYPQ